MSKLQYHYVVEADEVGALRIVLYEAEHACMLKTPAARAVRQSHEQLHHRCTQRLDRTNTQDDTKNKRSYD